MKSCLLKSMGAMVLGVLSLNMPIYGAVKPEAPDYEAFANAGIEFPVKWKMTKSDRFADLKNGVRKTVTSSEDKIAPVKGWGTLRMPDGKEWFYTSKYSEEPITGAYTGMEMVIYNENHQQVGSITDEFEIFEGDKYVNSVFIYPEVTQKFFNVNDDYELQVYFHAVTEDYTGHSYNKIYKLAPGQTQAEQTIEGHCIMATEDGSDLFAERYRMIYQRENIETTWVWFDDDNHDLGGTYIPTGETKLWFDIYGYANYQSQNKPRLIHSFEVDNKYISGAGENALPILMVTHNGKMWYATWQYEKEFFDPDRPVTSEPVVQPDNKLIIKLWNEDCFANLASNAQPTPVKVTTIDMTTNPSYLYTFPILGGFRGPADLSFDEFTSGDEPAYIITHENYEVAGDDFVDDIYVYNTDGELIKTIITDVTGFMGLTEVPGHPEQVAFINEYDQEYDIMSWPSAQIDAIIPFEFDGRIMTTSMDRLADGDSYLYVFSSGAGEEGPNSTIVHPIAYFNADGSFSHYDNINLGTDVVMAMPAIRSKWLDPYIFNTDDSREYMFLVKVPNATETANEEHLWVRNIQGKNLLDFGPSDEMGGELNSISLLNLGTPNAAMMCLYYHWSADESDKYYTMNFTSLPLQKFEGGTGKWNDPYLVASIGDMMAMAQNPSAYYKLVADIDFGGTRIPEMTTEFTGAFDGNGHVISNMVIEGNSLFGVLTGGIVDPENPSKNISGDKIKDLTLVSPELIPVYGEAGFLATTASYDGNNHPVISNVHIYGGKVDAPSFEGSFGGLVTVAAHQTTIQNCSLNDMHINLPKAAVGGILAECSPTEAIVKNCFFSGDINAQLAGGIAATTVFGSITDCRVDANIVAEDAAGGVVGEMQAYQNCRLTIDRAHVSGTLETTGTKNARVGGIVGDVWEASMGMAVTNSVVAVSSIKCNENVAKKTAHRVAGATTLDVEGQLDFDSDWWVDPAYEDERLLAEKWNEEKDEGMHQGEKNPYYPYKQGEPEPGFDKVYVLNSLAIENGDAATEDAANTREGKSIAAEDLTSDFLAETLGFKFGQDAENPWQMSGNLPTLWFEDKAKALTVSQNSLELEEGQIAGLVFTLVNGNAADINIQSSDDGVVRINSVDKEGAAATVEIEALTEGSATITATSGDFTKTVNVLVWKKVSGVGEFEMGISTLSYDGSSVTGEGMIEVYNVSGVKVAQGENIVSTRSLAKGIYIATNGTNTLKFAVK